jgi:hypothetical protein
LHGGRIFHRSAGDRPRRGQAGRRPEGYHERNVAMRTRAYRPEAPGCLEGRSLLSGVAGTAADPAFLTRREFNFVPEQIQEAFHEFRQGFGISELHDEINEATVAVPFGRKDGLAASINGILDTLQREMHAKNPNAVSTARNEVLAVTREAMQAQAQAGNVVVR